MENSDNNELRETYKLLAKFADFHYEELDVKNRGSNFPGWYHRFGSSEIMLGHKSPHFITRKTLDLRFKYSWDMLMKVVAKVESITDQYHGGFTVVISKDSCTVFSQNKSKERAYSKTYVSPKNKLKAVYESMILFVNWYNNNNNK